MDWSWTDILWHVLAIPLYQIISTTRHELAHAMTAVFNGIVVTDIAVIPHWRDKYGHISYRPKRDYQFYWGYVQYGEGWSKAGKAEAIAPYAVNVVLALFGFWFVPRLAELGTFHGWAFAIIMLWISPAIDTLVNLVNALVWRRGDFMEVFGWDEK